MSLSSKRYKPYLRYANLFVVFGDKVFSRIEVFVTHSVTSRWVWDEEFRTGLTQCPCCLATLSLEPHQLIFCKKPVYCHGCSTASTTIIRAPFGLRWFFEGIDGWPVSGFFSALRIGQASRRSVTKSC